MLSKQQRGRVWYEKKKLKVKKLMFIQKSQLKETEKNKLYMY